MGLNEKPRTEDIGPKLAPVGAVSLREGQKDEERAGKGQDNRSPSGASGISGGINRAPSGAKVAASIVLTILAAVILFRTALTNSISNLRRASLYLCSLGLFAIGFWLWMLSAPQ
jgi:hypothetical protein